MRVDVACGGTGGHVLPGLAVATVLETRGHVVRLWLAGRALEERLTASWQGEVCRVRSAGLPVGMSARRLPVLFGYLRSAFACRATMRRSAPDALLAMGGYASVGPVLAARMLRRPVVLHEGNALPGRSVQALARFAQTIALAFDEARGSLRHPRLFVTGFPLRQELEQAAATRRQAPRSTRPRAEGSAHSVTVLVLGGSQGARTLNQAVAVVVAGLKSAGRPLQVIHLAGEADVAMVKDTYADAGVQADVRSFMDDIWSAYAASDVVVARAGASTCAEIKAFDLPAVLIPYPYAARDHQVANARIMERSGRVSVLTEDALDPASLTQHLEAAMNADASPSPGGEQHLHAAEAVADLVEATMRS